MPIMHGSIKSLLIRKHNILTLTRSVVHDFTADMIKLHRSCYQASPVLSLDCFSSGTERIGCFAFVPPQSERSPGREASRFHKNCHLFSTTTQDSRDICKIMDIKGDFLSGPVSRSADGALAEIIC